jgi:hypothetical protein
LGSTDTLQKSQIPNVPALPTGQGRQALCLEFGVVPFLHGLHRTPALLT